MKLKIKATRVFRLLLAIMVILLVANCIVVWLKVSTGDGSHSYIKLFDFNKESNVPTFFSSMLLLLTALLLFYIGFVHQSQESRLKRYWFGLAVGFLYMSIDESAQIHEVVNGLIQMKFNLTGFFHYAWVLPFGIIASIVGVVYLIKFLPFIPGRIRTLFWISGGIYVAGAIGFEMIGGKVEDSGGSDVLYAVLYTFEEFFEMLGVSLFLYALLIYVQDELRVTIKTKKSLVSDTVFPQK
ncbi:peptidase M48 Ste24p [Mangrovibacterium diazotrophicum]|uniref:Uncharacterized protein n=1 Tax=Mangrovibacterium diazotrophicum TaxID=1261403 RepID=A0A419W7F1_9BACT|nr:peptidase M48 Ste24p [Mangrovibacterium diazotrophicum]RKD91375.1 hypothetical protein BC643_1728 [Mangrovibacterium diazotrophicum]